MSENAPGLRDQVLASTARLQQQLLEAVDKLQQSTNNQDQFQEAPTRSTRLVVLPPSSSRLSGSSNSPPPRTSTSGLNFFWNHKSLKRDRKSDKGKTKKKKLQTWTHTFVCLARQYQHLTPDSNERMILQLSGLGEDKISFNIDANSQEISNELYAKFPKLKDGGGFEMLRLPEGGGKVLQVIACPKNGYSVPYLRAVVHHAKIYLRPLQKDLDTDSLNDEDADPYTDVIALSPPKEYCLSCGALMYMSAIREHIKICEGKLKIESEVILSSVASPSNSVTESDFNQEMEKSPVKITLSDSDSDNDSLLNVALALSKEEALKKVTSLPYPIFEPQSLVDVVKHLRKDVKELEFDMVVRRSHVLVDAVNRTRKLAFDPSNRLTVEFVGEEGIDGGGLTREFFRILFRQFSSVYLDSTGCFKHNSVALQDGLYFCLGQLASMCLVHGGAAVRIFSTSVYSYLCGRKSSDIDVQICEISNVEIRDFVGEIMKTQSDEELQALLIDNCDLLSERGYSKPLPYVRLDERTNIVKTLTLHEVILKSLAESGEFLDGLGALNVAGTLKTHGGLLKEFYCNDPSLKAPLTANFLRKMFTRVVYSEKGSNQRQKEENVYMMFVDYLDKCEKVTAESVAEGAFNEGTINEDTGVIEGRVSLEMILSFFTGAYEIPPLGLPHEPQLNFSATSPYPTSSTCAIQLTLPTMFETKEEFELRLNVAFLSHGGFGLH